MCAQTIQRLQSNRDVIALCHWYLGGDLKMALGFVLIRSGKTPKHGNDCFEGRSFYALRSLETGGTKLHKGPQGGLKVGQEAEGMKQKHGKEP